MGFSVCVCCVCLLCVCLLCVSIVALAGVPYLVMLPGLDRLQRANPVLHLFPVLRAEDEPAERGDHLHTEGEGRRE